MARNEVDRWLSLSQALLHDLMPMDADIEIFGHGMDPVDFAALVDRESRRVDEALVSMSLAIGKDDVHRIFDRLSKDTVIALFSRWARYHEVWMQETHAHPWIPPSQKDIWRAILLAMAGDSETVVNTYTQLWPECSVELSGVFSHR